MKWIKDFFIEILKKVKEHIVTAIAVFIVGLIITMFFIFKRFLIVEFTLTLPVWAWAILCVVISCLPVIILKSVDIQRKNRQESLIQQKSKQEYLTDEDDIFNKLSWWVGQRLNFVREQTEDGKLVTWHFDLIDKKLGLIPGSAKKFLPAIFSVKPNPFRITLLNQGEKTIAIRYDLKIV